MVSPKQQAPTSGRLGPHWSQIRSNNATAENKQDLPGLEDIPAIQFIPAPWPFHHREENQDPRSEIRSFTLTASFSQSLHFLPFWEL